jgi:hypothetical protein
MTDAHALSIVRKFIENSPGEDARVNISHAKSESGLNWTVQRTGGELGAIVRSGTTLGEAIEKLFEGTRYSDAA